MSMGQEKSILFVLVILADVFVRNFTISVVKGEHLLCNCGSRRIIDPLHSST